MANFVEVITMRIFVLLLATVILLFVAGAVAGAEEATSRQVKGLDEQVQEIKSEVLEIAAELNQLEERLLFPAHSQVSAFISLADGESFRLDAVELALDGDVVAEHVYAFKELEALRMGGVQRLYTGNIPGGTHELQVSLLGKTETGADVQVSESFLVEKGVGPGIFDITLARGAISLKDR